jgi:hypothetical protein
VCSDGEYHIQPLLPGLDLLHYTSVSSPSHPLWLPRWRSIRSIVMPTKLTMQPRKSVMGLVHRSASLHRIAEAVAESTRE